MVRGFQRKARTNYMRLVADSTRERLSVVGFRTGGETDTDTDEDAWRIWQTNHLDADQAMVHEAALKFSDAYVIVGANPDDDTTPIITGEDPRQVITESAPINRRLVRAGLKTWIDELDRKQHAIVYLPDSISYFAAPIDNPEPQNQPQRTEEQVLNRRARTVEPAWEIEKAAAENVLGVVPVVRFIASPNLVGEGIGEFEDVIDVQDRINDTLLNRLMIAKLQAYRQRWLKGVPMEDEHGNALDLPFVPGVDLLWHVDDPQASFGEFNQVDLTPLLHAIDADVHAIVSLTGLPPHYVAGNIVNASADALAAAESRLVAKVKDRAMGFGESWEQVLRLAFSYLQQPERIGPDAEIIWADPERKSIAQLADAAVKQQLSGVPWRQRMELLGYTPTQINRMEAERNADLLLAAQLGDQASPAQQVAVAQGIGEPTPVTRITLAETPATTPPDANAPTQP
jgi:hypothetical protein